MSKPRFNIGDIVFNKVERKGSYESSICPKRSKLSVDKVERMGDSFKYTCDFDGYVFKEDELMSRSEMVDWVNSD